jgi:hypothetical protein
MFNNHKQLVESLFASEYFKNIPVVDLVKQLEQYSMK